ncbi:PREDICTED: zinc finger and BTB domain-containing protein 8A-like, partial [Dinoponera quadriceps]|uniref:Zinc finger and BTB domain-containing protein 8A-like n=1 Tax=Dinoponera quadriceps TaxID=609295 RepID=A0A6P3YA21_DINQU
WLHVLEIIERIRERCNYTCNIYFCPVEKDHRGLSSWDCFLFAGVAQYQHQEKQQETDYLGAMSLEQHLAFQGGSSQSYDSAFGDSAHPACDSNAFSDWYTEGATKQQQQQQLLQQQDSSQRRFLCPKCNNSYKYLGDMKKHVRFQCGQEPKFQCPYCRKRAKVSSNMYAHVRSMHNDLPIYIIDLDKQSSISQL